MGFLGQLAYNLLFCLALLVVWPYYGWRLWRRGNLGHDFGQRLAWYSRAFQARLAGGCDVWIHAVSVGEVRLAAVILQHLREIQPDVKVVLTTTTQTGRRVARKLEDNRIVLAYNPVDFLPFVRRAFDLFRPARLILIEAEVWPNYVWCARRRGIPVYVANARLSDRTERRFRRFRPLVRPILEKVDLVLAQDEEDVRRLASVGYASEAIFNLGSLKYDVADAPLAGLNELETWWGRMRWPQNARVLLAASTHPGEEEWFARLFLELVPRHPDLRLVLAPRHAERGHQIRAACERLGLTAILRTQLDATRLPDEAPAVLVLNSTGELPAVYTKAFLTFVGKSLRSKGGQNFIEATRAGNAVLVGPHMQNFRNLTRQFVARGAIVQAADEAELAAQIRRLLANPEECRLLGQRASKLFRDNLGAGRRTAEIIAASWRRPPAPHFVPLAS